MPQHQSKASRLHKAEDQTLPRKAGDTPRTAVKTTEIPAVEHNRADDSSLRKVIPLASLENSAVLRKAFLVLGTPSPVHQQ